MNCSWKSNKTSPASYKCSSVCSHLCRHPHLYVFMWVHVLPADVEENPLRRAWWKDEMACVNSVGQALVSSDFCLPVTAVCRSFPVLESEAANRANRPACLAAWRWRNTATDNNLSQLTSVYKRNSCRSYLSHPCIVCDLYFHSIWVQLMWGDNKETVHLLWETHKQEETKKESMCVCVFPAIKHWVRVLLFLPRA